MWDHRYLLRLDWKLIFIILALMIVSLLVISSTDPSGQNEEFFTPRVCKQLEHFLIGGAVFLFFAAFDYNKIREWAWIGYLLTTLTLLGLFFVPAIQNVHRWYRLPFVGMSIQPSEYAKLILVITLSWFLERNKATASNMKTGFLGCLIALIPFVLILKQPDLGTALVLCPITYVMFYLGNMHPFILRCMMTLGFVALIFILMIFLGFVSHDEMRPLATKFLKEYQYERLDPSNHHQKCSLIAIGVGGWSGTGWHGSEFTGRGWLPYGYTDSVFAAFGEEFGLIGMLIMLAGFYALIYFGFQVTEKAKDHFGRMLSAGVTVYIAMHIIVNIAMMCALLPITGVPLILISYGGTSVIVTLAALGILQSVYSRRFMF